MKRQDMIKMKMRTCSFKEKSFKEGDYISKYRMIDCTQVFSHSITNQDNLR